MDLLSLPGSSRSPNGSHREMCLPSGHAIGTPYFNLFPPQMKNKFVIAYSVPTPSWKFFAAKTFFLLE